MELLEYNEYVDPALQALEILKREEIKWKYQKFFQRTINELI